MENTHRLKRTMNLIQLTREAQLSVSDLIYPMFIAESSRADEALPGLAYYSLETALHACEEACKLGIPGIMIFDIVDKKDDTILLTIQMNIPPMESILPKLSLDILITRYFRNLKIIKFFVTF